MAAFVTVKIDARQAISGLRNAARAADKEATRGIRKACKDVALPIVRAHVNGELPGTTAAGATRRGGYIAQKHPGAGINEFGGVLRGRITPKKKGGAVMTPYGPKAYVAGPRTFTAKHVLYGGIVQARPAMAQPLRDAVLDAYRPYFQVGA